MGRQRLDRVDTLRAFAAAARAGSFAAGGRSLGVTRDHMSKAVAELEQRLGTPLFLRSTRHVQLTSAGATYLERVSALLRDLDEADEAVRGLDATPCGRLRVHGPTSFGLTVLAPLSAGFLARYPNIQLEMGFDDQPLQPMPAEVDLVLRIGLEAEVGLAVETLGIIRRGLYAAPGYLQDHPVPRSPEELVGHRLLLYSHARPKAEWALQRDGEPRSIRIQPVFTSTTGMAVAAAARGGAGIAVLPNFLATRDLVPVLEGWELPKLEILVLTHPARQQSPKIRAYIDYLRSHLTGGAGAPAVQDWPGRSGGGARA